jgi:hypothetical protein
MRRWFADNAVPEVETLRLASDGQHNDPNDLLPAGLTPSAGSDGMPNQAFLRRMSKQGAADRPAEHGNRGQLPPAAVAE